MSFLKSRFFEADADPKRLQKIAVEGLDNPAWGTVYAADSLKHGGMPLGGLGTGYLILDPDGRFGKGSLFNHLPAPLSLGKPFLSISTEGQEFVAATRVDGVGDAVRTHCFGHYPVADIRFEFEAPFEINVRAFSPFLPGDAAESNTPAAVFEVRLTARDEREAAVTLSLDAFPRGQVTHFQQGRWTGAEVAHPTHVTAHPPLPHTYAVAVENGEVHALDGQGGTTDSARPAIHVSGSTAALGVAASAHLHLRPGETGMARFVVAWHQPNLREGSNRIERHLYATRFPDAAHVAAHAIERHPIWLKRILAFQDALYGSGLPGWLTEALIAAPYALAKNSLWLAHTRPDDWWTEKGLFLVNESFSTCAVTETMPCRFFGHWVSLFFFPDLERITLEAIRHFQLRDGEPPFCLGLGFAIRDPRYHCQHTCGAGEYAQIIHRFFQRTGDKEFLREFYPSARDAINFMLSLDKDGDGLVEDHPHTIEGECFPGNNPLDCWPWHGASAYTAGKGLASLVSGIAMAEVVGDAKQADAWRAILKKGQTAYETTLWTGSYYRTYHEPKTGRRNDACFSAQLSGVWATRVLGLEDPLPKERIETALEAIARLNLPASPYGMMDAVFPDGAPCIEGGPCTRNEGNPNIQNIWSRDIFIQCNATAAMVFLYMGQRERGEAAARAMLDTLFRGPDPMPWSQPCGLNSQTGSTCHGHDYYDHMVVWSYPLAFLGQSLQAACQPGGWLEGLLKAARHN